MDILRVLSTSTDMEVRRKAVGIALHMVTGRNVEEVVGLLRKQLTRTLEAEYEKVRHMSSMSPALATRKLTEFWGTEHGIPSTTHPKHPHLRHQIFRRRCVGRPRAHGVFGRAVQPLGRGRYPFVREVVEKFPNLRKRIVEHLLESFADIKSGKVFRGAMWIAGEYCVDTAGEFWI
jgi:coatomer subunit beta